MYVLGVDLCVGLWWLQLLPPRLRLKLGLVCCCRLGDATRCCRLGARSTWPHSWYCRRSSGDLDQNKFFVSNLTNSTKLNYLLALLRHRIKFNTWIINQSQRAIYFEIKQIAVSKPWSIFSIRLTHLEVFVNSNPPPRRS